MTLINGEANSLISVMDRGFCYGDGFFETFFCLNDVLQNWPYHWARMQKSAAVLQMALPEESLFLSDFEKLETKKFQEKKACVVKIIVTRGVGGRGYSPFNCESTNRIIFSASLPDYQQLRLSGMNVSILDAVLSDEGQVAGLKHLNRLGQVIAKIELDKKGTDEGVLCNSRGYVREGVSSNLFMVSDGEVITPPLDDCGVAGVLRSKVIDLAPKLLNTAVIESNFMVSDLLAADEVFFTNSLLGVCPVKRIGSRIYKVGDIAQCLLSENLEADAVRS